MERFTVPDEYHRDLDANTVATLERWINVGGDSSGFYDYLFSGDNLNAARLTLGANFTGFATLLRFLKISTLSEAYGSPEAFAAWRGLMNVESSP